MDLPAGVGPGVLSVLKDYGPEVATTGLMLVVTRIWLQLSMGRHGRSQVQSDMDAVAAEVSIPDVSKRWVREHLGNHPHIVRHLNECLSMCDAGNTRVAKYHVHRLIRHTVQLVYKYSTFSKCTTKEQAFAKHRGAMKLSEHIHRDLGMFHESVYGYADETHATRVVGQFRRFIDALMVAIDQRHTVHRPSAAEVDNSVKAGTAKLDIESLATHE